MIKLGIQFNGNYSKQTLENHIKKYGNFKNKIKSSKDHYAIEILNECEGTKDIELIIIDILNTFVKDRFTSVYIQINKENIVKHMFELADKNVPVPQPIVISSTDIEDLKNSSKWFFKDIAPLFKEYCLLHSIYEKIKDIWNVNEEMELFYDDYNVCFWICIEIEGVK